MKLSMGTSHVCIEKKEKESEAMLHVGMSHVASCASHLRDCYKVLAESEQPGESGFWSDFHLAYIVGPICILSVTTFMYISP